MRVNAARTMLEATTRWRELTNRSSSSGRTGGVPAYARWTHPALHELAVGLALPSRSLQGPVPEAAQSSVWPPQREVSMPVQ